jgi:hypothetical protein
MLRIKAVLLLIEVDALFSPVLELYNYKYNIIKKVKGKLREG